MLLAATYSLVTPIFEAPDEVWHFTYVRHLAQGHGLPVVDPTHPGPLAQEGTQPPFYYALTAAITAWIDIGEGLALIRENPHAAIGVASPRGNVNRVLPVDRQDPRLRGAVWAVQLARLVSALLAGLTVLATYGLVYELWPERPVLAAGAAVVNAFTPQFLFIGGSINNDNAVSALSALGLWLLAWTLHRQSAVGQWPGFFRLLILGIVAGLAALAKLSGLLLVLVATMALALDGGRRRDLRAALGGPAVVAMMAGLVAGWWYARNWLLYGDPLALNVHLAVVGRRTPMPDLPDLIPELEGLRRSYWAMFGWFNVPAPDWLYFGFDLFSLGALGGLTLFIARRVQRRAWRDLAPLGLLLAWIGLVSAGWVRWTQATQATQGRLLFPAISAISALLFLGLAEFWPKRWTAQLVAALAGVMALVAIAMPFMVIAPAYTPPRSLTRDDIASVPNRLDVSFSSQLQLLGYAVQPMVRVQSGRPTLTDSYPVVRQGDWFNVVLYWQALAPMERDYSVFIHVVDENGVIVAQEDSYPGRGTLPTSRWPAGEAIADWYAVHIPALAQAPRLRRVEAGVYDLVTGERLRLPDGADRVALGELRIEPAMRDSRSATMGREMMEKGVTPVSVDFAGRIALVGYALDRTAVQPGQALQLTLYWQALRPMRSNYTVFVHVLGPGDHILAGDDRQPADGQHPTSAWGPGEIVEDRHTLAVPENAPPGQYELEIGLYRRRTGERLAVRSGGGPDKDRVVLGRVWIRER